MKILDFAEIFLTYKYPAGEPHVKIRDDADKYSVIADAIIFQARDWNDLATLVLADHVLDRFSGIRPRWIVPYMPFGRHDRAVDNRDTRPLELAIAWFRTLDVTIIDAHSDVSGMIPNIPQSAVVTNFKAHGMANLDDVVYAIPDAGAAKKAYSWLDRPYVQCLKKRNVHDGKLSNFQVVDGDTINGRNVFVVDDICDGGGTFIGLAEELQKYNPASLNLAITHGLFTKGGEGLKALTEAGYQEIWTLDIYSPPKAVKHNVLPASTRMLVETYLKEKIN